VSSSTMKSTLGAPVFARRGAGHAGLDSSTVLPIVPGKRCPGSYSLNAIVGPSRGWHDLGAGAEDDQWGPRQGCGPGGSPVRVRAVATPREAPEPGPADRRVPPAADWRERGTART